MWNVNESEVEISEEKCYNNNKSNNETNADN